MKTPFLLKNCEQDEEEQPDSFFPRDIIFDILTRIPLGSLYKCRLVSEQWKQLSYDSQFICQHRLRTRTVSGFFVQGLDYSERYTSFRPMDKISQIPQPSLNFLPEKVKIEASSSHGLVYCVGEGSKITRNYICKPATREFKTLPNPRTRFFTEATALFVQSHEPFHFEILRFSHNNGSLQSLHCEIFDSHKWVWERSEDIALRPYFVINSYDSMVTVRDRFYVLIKKYASGGYRILEYRMDRKTWKTIPIPKEEEENRKLLVKCKGQLSFLHSIGSLSEVWVLSSYSKGVWSQMCKINFEAIDGRKIFPSVMSLYTDEVVFIAGFYENIWYNTKSRKYRVVKFDYQLPMGIYIYESDLVPHGMDWR